MNRLTLDAAGIRFDKAGISWTPVGLKSSIGAFRESSSVFQLPQLFVEPEVLKLKASSTSHLGFVNSGSGVYLGLRQMSEE